MLINNLLIGTLVENLHFAVIDVAWQRIGIAEGGELPQSAKSDHRISAIGIVILRWVISVEVCWSLATLRCVAQIVTSLVVIGITILKLESPRTGSSLLVNTSVVDRGSACSDRFSSCTSTSFLRGA